jgi:hypothetical protein
MPDTFHRGLNIYRTIIAIIIIQDLNTTTNITEIIGDRMNHFISKRYTLLKNPILFRPNNLRSYSIDDNGTISLTFTSGAVMRYNVLGCLNDTTRDMSYFEQDDYNKLLEFLQQIEEKRTDES